LYILQLTGRPTTPRLSAPCPSRLRPGDTHAARPLALRLLHLALEVTHMTITLPGLLILIIIAAVCGALGRALVGGVRGGFIVSMVLGFIGALVGPWIAQQFKLPEPFMLQISGQSFPVLWSIIGAAVFVAIIHLVSRR
jgi:uncharacterized membrane protein YeaQ/YmgE (transglycosylase-associated protein family)